MAKQDLFQKYYKSGKSQYIKAPIICSSNGDYDNEWFEIGDGSAEINNKATNLAKLDLNDIMVPVNTYITNTIMLRPREWKTIMGTEYGYMNKSRLFVFPKNLHNLTIDLDYRWDEFVKISFFVKYMDRYNNLTETAIKTGPIDLTDNRGLINIINDKLEQEEIHIRVELVEKINEIITNSNKIEENDVFGCKPVPTDEELKKEFEEEDYEKTRLGLKFTACEVGYEFSVGNVYITFIPGSEDFPDSPFILEETNRLLLDSKYDVETMRYPNGAFRGVVLKPIYPLYNNDIEDSNKYFMLNHMKDKVRAYLNYYGEKTLKTTEGEDAILNIELKDKLFTQEWAIVDGYSRPNDFYETTVFNKINDECNLLQPLQEMNGRLYLLLYELYRKMNGDKDMENEDLLNDTGKKLIEELLHFDDEETDVEELIYNIVKKESDKMKILEDNQVLLTNYLTKLYRNLSMNKEDVDDIIIEEDKEEDEEDDKEIIEYYLDKFDNMYDTTKLLNMKNYLLYVDDNKLWKMVGDLYILIGQEDSEHVNSRSMVPSMVVYNPHNYPIKISYMAFT